MSAYTFTSKTAPTYPGQLSNFGGLANDGNRVAMLVGAGPQTVDISASPITSPESISNASVTTLTVPLNAINVNFLATTNTVNVSEADPTVADKYFTIPTGVQISVDVARVGLLYLKANTGAATLSFWFTTV